MWGIPRQSLRHLIAGGLLLASAPFSSAAELKAAKISVESDRTRVFLDLDRNGRIDNGSELFGVGTKLANGQHAGNGYEAMAQYDSNRDGVLDAKDARFKDLVVWVDANHDGVLTAEEFARWR